MVAGSRKRLWQLSEDAFAVMMNFAGFAVKQLWRAHDPSAKRGTHRLVAQTNAEYRKLSGQPLNQFNRDTGFLRSTRPRRNHNPLRLALGNLFHGNLVVAVHFHFAT